MAVDNRPVGFFDSGLGGISVLGEAMAHLPHENFIYLGDTLHIPYGDKPPELVMQYAREAAQRLIGMNCKAIVIACNTATSVAAAALRQELSLPIIGMEPALKPASLLEGEGRVLVMATQVTLRLPKFQRLMEHYGQNAIPVPCPGLMECVEAGALSGSRVDAVLEPLLAPYRNTKIKAVVLGCTHYPFLKKAIARYFPSDVPLIDGNAGAARQLGRRLEEEGITAEGEGGSVTFLSTLEGEEPLRRMQQMLELWRSASLPPSDAEP